MSKNSNSETRPSYIKRVERINPEKQLTGILSKKFGQRFKDYRKEYFKILDNKNNNYDHVPDYPLNVLVEVVNKCNLECIMCLSSHRKGDTKVISNETISKLLTEFKENNLPALMFGAGDEPLMFSDIDQMWKEANLSGIMDIFIFTNGTLLNEDMCKKILEHEVSRVYISLDAATEETYQKIRLTNKKINEEVTGNQKLKIINEEQNSLQSIENNIKKLIEMRDARNLQLPQIRVSYTVQYKNKHEINMFKEKWENVVDFIEFQETQNIQFDKLATLSETERWKRRQPMYKKNYKKDCKAPFHSATVWADGSVIPCCTFQGKNLTLGNINGIPELGIPAQSVKELWNGEKINELREQFRTGELNIVCQSCLNARQTEIFDVIEEVRK
jgi:MoaA/NifB/PqqE/SkfB family radical SAM enzyme|tara:strand:- start:11 stop:1174 length:1164 start_codon:yes stop_codon:yes gene_type:complete